MSRERIAIILSIINSVFKQIVVYFFIKNFEENHVEILGSIILIIAGIMLLVYSIKLIIIAFQESILWGLLYLFLPFANLYFIITRWPECKSPFLRSLVAFAFIILGAVMASPSISY